MHIKILKRKPQETSQGRKGRSYIPGCYRKLRDSMYWIEEASSRVNNMINNLRCLKSGKFLSQPKGYHRVFIYTRKLNSSY